MIKGRRVRDTRSEVLKIPQITQSLQDRSRTVRLGLASNGINTVVLNMALGRIRRDQPGRHTATKTVVGQSIVASIGSGLGVRLVVRTDSKRGSNVVEESTSLIEGEEKEGLVPLGAGTEGLVDLLNENLAEGDVAGGVHGVGVQAAAGGVNVGELGEKAQVGILVEVLQRDNVVLGVLRGPVEEQGIGQEVAVSAVVVAPRDALLRSDLEDTGGVDAGVIEALVIRAMAVGCTGDGAETVGVGGLCDC